jgi:Trp operon repressor
MKNKDTSSEWKDFLQLLLSLDSENLIDEFCDYIFTLSEKDTLKWRCALTKELLLGGIPQREISQKLNISISKITSGSNALKIISPDLKEHLVSFFSNQ